MNRAELRLRVFESLMSVTAGEYGEEDIARAAIKVADILDPPRAPSARNAKGRFVAEDEAIDREIADQLDAERKAVAAEIENAAKSAVPHVAIFEYGPAPLPIYQVRQLYRAPIQPDPVQAALQPNMRSFPNENGWE